MEFILLFCLGIFYLTFNQCFSLKIILPQKLVIDKFIEESGFKDLKLIGDDVFRDKIKEITEEMLDSLKAVSAQEGSKFTLQKYKTKVQHISEDLYIEIKDYINAHNNLLDDLNYEFRNINSRIVQGDSKAKLNSEYGQKLLNYLNAGPFEKSIKFLKQSNRSDKVILIDDILKLVHKRYYSQNNILKSVLLLHKLSIEIELTKIVYLFTKKPAESYEFENRLRKLVRMLHLLTSFELFLTGNFKSSFEISISNIINLQSDTRSSNTKDYSFIVYPKLEFGELISNPQRSDGNLDIIYSSEKSPLTEDQKNNNIKESSEWKSPTEIEILKDDFVAEKYFEEQIKLFNESISSTEFNSNYISPHTYTEYIKAEIDIISPILSVEQNTTKEQEEIPENISNKKYKASRTSIPLLEGEKTRETLKNIDNEVKLYIKNKELKRISNINDKIVINDKYPNLESLNMKKCLKFQYICSTVRHLEYEEMMELDKNLFPYGVKLPLEKDNNIIWSISESLVENFGARKRLIELLSEKIIDFTLSIDRLNTSPIMNTGEGRNDQINFYRGKHYEILLVLIALKDFLNSNSSHEISITRLKFLERFVPLMKRSTIQKFKFSDDLENKKTYSMDTNNINNKRINIRSTFNGNIYKYDNPEFNEFSYSKITETITEPSLYDLCTRFITVLSVTKSVKTFNDNSYKFAQKVCSMIFEQPIHNILSSQDYAWLTGFTLVHTVNSLIMQHNLPEEILIDHKIALRALNHSFSQKAYNFHQACTQSLISQKSTAIYRNNVSLHFMKPIMKISCAEYFGISVFLYEN
ncbi:putative signal peptide-containing protein [Cryptosporidium canis]|uniref:Signal peptide-containing protein n=1 Tax=Cryptosporidium canis TaxID=195482 RepID=A0ABQ8P5E7_9CRYT|nr:putative signal peptide-containing protein [Cryptosporidium canis]